MISGIPRTFSSADSSRRGARIAARAAVGTATAAVFLSMVTLSASAAPGDTSAGTVVANVNVNSTINLAITQGSFELNGTPLSDVTKTGAVTGLVTTNNATGYSIGVQAAAATLQASTGGNTDSIPIANLKVANVAGAYTSLSNTARVITTTKATRSDLTGDEFSDDYRVTIPDVNSDTYSVTLNYTATALA